MYYVSEGNVYVKEGNAFRNVSITAKDKVTITKELESVTVTPGDVVVETLINPSKPCSLDEVIKKFNLSEERPIRPLIGDPFGEMTVKELKAYASENGIDLGDATKKADILKIIRDSLATADDGGDDETDDGGEGDDPAE